MLYLLVALFLLAVPARAAILFDTNFETCAVGSGNDFPCENWNDFGNESLALLRVSTLQAFPGGGTKSVRFTFDNINGSSGTPSIFNSSYGNLTHIFSRVARFQTSGFQYGSNGITKIWRFHSDLGYPKFWISVRFGFYTLGTEGEYDTGASAWYGTGVAPRSNQWDQIELEVKLNDPGIANGHARIWINGTQRMEVLNKQWRGATLSSKCGTTSNNCPSNQNLRTAEIYLQSGLGDVFFDRFAVGTTRVGIVGSQPVADTTAPTPPTDVAAQ